MAAEAHDNTACRRDPEIAVAAAASFAVPLQEALPTLSVNDARSAIEALPCLPDDAHKIFGALTVLRACVMQHARDILLFCPAELASVVVFLAKETGNLRSAISRHAVVASTELAALTGVALAALPSTDSLIAALLIKAASDKKFIRLEAEAALVNFANVAPSTVGLFTSFLRHSSSKSRPLSIASASFAESVLNHLPAEEIASLDLLKIAPLVACYLTAKSADARGHATSMSSTIASHRGVSAWTDAIKATCKPIDLVQLSASFVAAGSNNNCEAGWGGSDGSMVAGAAASGTPGRYVSPKRVALREFLRERSSARNASARGSSSKALCSPGGGGSGSVGNENVYPGLGHQMSPVPAMNPFTPGPSFPRNSRRISKSPVLILQKQTPASAARPTSFIQRFEEQAGL